MVVWIYNRILYKIINDCHMELLKKEIRNYRIAIESSVVKANLEAEEIMVIYDLQRKTEPLDHKQPRFISKDHKQNTFTNLSRV